MSGQTTDNIEMIIFASQMQFKCKTKSFTLHYLIKSAFPFKKVERQTDNGKSVQNTGQFRFHTNEKTSFFQSGLHNLKDMESLINSYSKNVWQKCVLNIKAQQGKKTKDKYYEANNRK